MTTITVSAMTSGETWVLEASASTTIGELKVIMQAEHGGGLPSAQRFVLAGEVLDDALTVEDAGVEEESVLSWMTTYIAETITITVNATSLQQTLEFEIPVTTTVLQLKEIMTRKHDGGLASGQRFVLAGEVLPDDACLAEEGVEESSVITWMMILMDDSAGAGSDDIMVTVSISGEVDDAAVEIAVHPDWEVSFALARIVAAHPRLDPAAIGSMTMSVEGETLESDSLLDEFDIECGIVITCPTTAAEDEAGGESGEEEEQQQCVVTTGGESGEEEEEEQQQCVVTTGGESGEEEEEEEQQQCVVATKESNAWFEQQLQVVKDQLDEGGAAGATAATPGEADEEAGGQPAVDPETGAPFTEEWAAANFRQWPILKHGKRGADPSDPTWTAADEYDEEPIAIAREGVFDRFVSLFFAMYMLRLSLVGSVLYLSIRIPTAVGECIQDTSSHL